MKTVWLVWFIDFYDNRELCGIFATETAAEDFIASHSDRAAMEMEAHQVD